MTEKRTSASGAMSENNGASARSKVTTADARKDARPKDLPATSAVKSETSGTGSHASPKKRRKVNHGKLLRAPHM